MNLISLSVNYRVAPVEIRETLTVADNDVANWSSSYQSQFPHRELMLLSTCNRTEIYTAQQSELADEDPQSLRHFMALQTQIPIETIEPVTEVRTGVEAATHLFRVATGLDSMVPGESQILGQLKRAYEKAHALGTLGKTLHLTIQQAITAAKRIRQETGVDSGRISVGSVAVDFIKQIFSRFEDKTVVVLGAGEMIKLTLRHLLELAPKDLVIANRSLDNANDLADFVKTNWQYDRVSVRGLADLQQSLASADIVLACTGATDPIVTHDFLKPIMKKRRQRPLCMIDMAVPRDIEEGVNRLNNVYLYNIDDLQKVIENTLNDRKDVFQSCEQLIQTAVNQCAYQMKHQEIGVLVKRLRTHFHDLAAEEKQRTSRKLINELSANQQISPDIQQYLDEKLDEYSHRLINKILHAPMAQLKGKEPLAKDQLPFFAHALEQLFLPDDIAPEPDPNVEKPPSHNE